MAHVEMDFSTINLEKLYSLPVHKKPPTYRYDECSGVACFMDPPGYPSYFVRHVWTQYGNFPGRGAVSVIIGPDGKAYIVQTRDTETSEYEALLRELWVPLPLDHERTRMWIREAYRYFYKSYVHHETGNTFIYPVPGYMLKVFNDDPRFSDEWRQKEKEAVERYNAEIQEYYRKLATPENHMAVRRIRKFYPDYQPEIDLIENPPSMLEGLWWETASRRPMTPEECDRTNRNRSNYALGRHPVNKTWCQWCGWREVK